MNFQRPDERRVQLLLHCYLMEEKTYDEKDIQKKFQIKLGGETAWVEIISSINHIYAVQIAAQPPIFISLIRDKDNKPKWISIPQGNDKMAEAIGRYIEEVLQLSKGNSGK